MFSDNTKNWSVFRKNRKILTICWNFLKLSDVFIFLCAQKRYSVFSRSSANFGEKSRSRGVIKSIPRGIEEWKKVRDLEDRGTRNSSCHPYFWMPNKRLSHPATFQMKGWNCHFKIIFASHQFNLSVTFLIEKGDPLKKIIIMKVFRMSWYVVRF